MNSIRTGMRGVAEAPGQTSAVDAAIARMTPRERWLSAVGLGVVLTVGVVQAAQWSSDQRQRYTLAEAELALAKQRATPAGRARLDGFEQTQARTLASWSEAGRSIWLARLGVERRLRLAVDAAGLTDAKIALAETPEAASTGNVATSRAPQASPMGEALLRAEVTGPYQGGGVAELLKRLAMSDKAYVLESLQVSQTDAPSYKLVLLFPVRIEAAEPAR